MSTLRQDAWTQDEDLILAEVVLRHIRDGSTQLAAFEEVGKRLSRTAAACGFRWNSTVRKQYESAITIAKKQRKGEKLNHIDKQTTEKQNNKQKPSIIAQTDQTVSFEDVIAFLSSAHETVESTEILRKQNEELKNELTELQKERRNLLAQIDILNEKYTLIEEDYKALIEIMERARKMIVLQEEEGSKFKFQMDKNGNLQRINK
ncbi:RsfA family transcriptional regulator [Calidifontibacillus oryziterrae]|uniref:RsfA family transcriptional regulator n=1 Tax=Calidifontibacillus oryziterrae TaxID=1191699 RepID=UPI0002E2F6C2|nr:RsfA family transcriptional regulator [Calidifontibacillus oryziterrae]